MRAVMGRRSSSGSAAAKPAAPTSDWFKQAFEKFYDAEEDSIGPEGVEKLCAAMKVDPSDVKLLVLAWLLRAANMGYFSREEWMSGNSVLGVATSPETLCERLDAVYAAARKSNERLRDLHNYTHLFCRTEGKKKVIGHESAIAMLNLLHASAYPAYIPPMCEFLAQHETSTKRGVSADEWSMILQFCNEIEPDCSNYQDDGAWPLLLDDYVEWYREKKG